MPSLDNLQDACSAPTDVCLSDKDYYILLVKADKQFGIPHDPGPLLIAGAIASYQRNNFVRDRVYHIPTLDETTFPGITLVGTFLTFCKIKVTAELSNAVMGRTHPANAVVVYRNTPRLEHRNSEEKRPLENRAAIVRCYEASKPFFSSSEFCSPLNYFSCAYIGRGFVFTKVFL
jgi:hypothetical protein